MRTRAFACACLFSGSFSVRPVAASASSAELADGIRVSSQDTAAAAAMLRSLSRCDDERSDAQPSAFNPLKAFALLLSFVETGIGFQIVGHAPGAVTAACVGQPPSVIGLRSLRMKAEERPALTDAIADAEARKASSFTQADESTAWAASPIFWLMVAAFTLGGAEVATAAPPGDALSQGFDATASMTLASATATAPAVDWGTILQKAGKKALGGGKAGAAAAVVQVSSLMWLRTAMNYQYRYGGDLNSALKTLYGEGGVQRLYQGLPFALVQGPLARFGDTAANVGILALLDSVPETAGLALPIKTGVGSFAAGLWRILCMPLDTSKTAFQVEGEAGFEKLKQKISEQGPGPLYQGSIATASATFAGNYPWFLTYNFCDGQLPPVSKEDLLLSLSRAAALGLAASCVSDTVSNSLRVIKTTQQTALLNSDGSGPGGGVAKDAKGISIPEAFQLVMETDGVRGLFGRGLQTRLLTNALQGALFSILWKYFQTVLSQ